LRLAVEAAGIALWSWNMDTDVLDMDDVAFSLWGMEPSESVTFADLSAHIHPEDLARVRPAFSAARAELGLYEIDFRIVVGGAVRWISARGKGDDDAMHDQTLFGILLDVSGRKQAEESHALLAGEMSHRVKNLLTIATGLTYLTSRTAVSAADMARDLTRRLSTLGQAHDLVRPIAAGGKAGGALLGDLLGILLKPYDGTETSGRVRLSVPCVTIGERSATALALVIHELATNSMKYGALSAREGRLALTHSDEDGRFVLRWIEGGGPSVIAPPVSGGFGSTLIARSVSAELGGSIRYDWLPEGVVVTLVIDPTRLDH
jgi:two-component sensor histidine kinase